MSNETVGISFRCPAELAEAFTKLRSGASQTAAIVNAIEYMVSIGQLIGVENPPLTAEIDQTELGILKRNIESLKAAIMKDKATFDRFNKAELKDDPIYIKLYDFYGEDITPFLGVEHNDLINIGRTIFSDDLDTARRFATGIINRQKKINMYEAEHQYGTLRKNLLAALKTSTE